MTQFGDEVVGMALDLLRSLWAELGLDGVPSRHDSQALDLEPLIVFTACFADSRLRDKASDWCAVNRRYVSIIRLNHFSWRFGESAREAYERFAASSESAGRERDGQPQVSVTPDLRRPSLIQLRLRALAGVSARAEVLKLLLANPAEPRSAASLVPAAGYGKSGLAQALDMLTLAGITAAAIEKKRTVYRLSRPTELAQALSDLPEKFPDWAAIFVVLGAILRFAKDGSDGRSRVKAAATAVQAISEECMRIPGAHAPPRITDEASVVQLESWARTFASSMAVGGAESPPREVTYTVHRLRLGGWIATVKEAGYAPRPLALSDSPELRPERRAHRRLKADEVAAGAEVVESMFVDIRTRELQRRQGSLVRRQSTFDSSLPALSHEFASELLTPMHKGQAATFTEEFLRRWSASHRDRYPAAG